MISGPLSYRVVEETGLWVEANIQAGFPETLSFADPRRKVGVYNISHID